MAPRNSNLVDVLGKRIKCYVRVVLTFGLNEFIRESVFAVRSSPDFSTFVVESAPELPRCNPNLVEGFV